MNELGFDITDALSWFPVEEREGYLFVEVGNDHARAWSDLLGIPVRRCYVADEAIHARVSEGHAGATVVAAKIPDPGKIMAGDFGEIVTYFFHAATSHPRPVLGVKKWRLKQDRLAPAPHSDVVQFILPSWPTPTPDDELLCSEVKVKSTQSSSWRPINAAIEGCAKDRTSRLARTLLWLRDRAISEGVGEVQVAQINRFINAIDAPQAKRRFFAVAVISTNLVDDELAADAPDLPSGDYTVVVIAVPNLRSVYTAVYAAVTASVP